MTETQTVNVALGDRSYDIRIGKSLLVEAARHISPHLGKHKKCIILTDSSIEKLHLPTLENALNAANINYSSFVIPAGEQSKSFAELERLSNAILETGIDRQTTLIALGGGVVGDLGGFLASILLRGIPFIQIPTTLLAMVDSSVGGKTAINSPVGKNLIGAFYQPQLVLADIALLTTLPARQMQAGYAEIVKYGLINDRDFFDWLKENITRPEDASTEQLSTMVARSCQHKAQIVSADEKEKGARALLNLGHTFGHALEAEMGYSNALLHGEAVAIGMVMAFAFSAQYGSVEVEDVASIKAALRNANLPIHPGEIKGFDAGPEALINHMRKDKKVNAGAMVFILAHAIGETFVANDVQENDLLAFLNAYLQDS